MKWLVLLALVAGAAAPAKKKTVKKAPAPADAVVTDAAIRIALDGEGQHVADCVMADAPPGAWSLTVKVKLAINSAGQLMSNEVTLEPAGPAATRACIEKVLSAVPYPKSASPLINISREWSFAMK